MTKRQGEVVLCLVLWSAALVLWRQTQELRSPADLFPKIILLTMTFLACILFIKNMVSKFREKKGQKLVDDHKLMTKKALKKVVAIALAGAIYIYVIPIAGFYLASALFLSSLYFGLGSLSGWNGVMKSVIGGVVVTLVIFFAFGYLLNVRTPDGWLF